MPPATCSQRPSSSPAARRSISAGALRVKVRSRIGVRVDALLDQARDAEHQGAGLAAAGAGDDQHRPLGGGHRLELGGVEQARVVEPEAGLARRRGAGRRCRMGALIVDGRRVALAVATRYGLYQLSARGGQWHDEEKVEAGSRTRSARPARRRLPAQLGRARVRARRPGARRRADPAARRRAGAARHPARRRGEGYAVDEPVEDAGGWRLRIVV